MGIIFGDIFFFFLSLLVRVHSFPCLFIRLCLDLFLYLCGRRGLVLVVTRCWNFPSHLEPPRKENAIKKKLLCIRSRFCLVQINRLEIWKNFIIFLVRGEPSLFGNFTSESFIKEP